MKIPHHLKCNDLNFVNAEIVKNTSSDGFSIYMFCSNNSFHFATINDRKLHHVKAVTTIEAVLAAILLRFVQH